MEFCLPRLFGCEGFFFYFAFQCEGPYHLQLKNKTLPHFPPHITIQRTEVESLRHVVRPVTDKLIYWSTDSCRSESQYLSGDVSSDYLQCQAISFALDAK